MEKRGILILVAVVVVLGVVGWFYLDGVELAPKQALNKEQKNVENQIYLPSVFDMEQRDDIFPYGQSSLNPYYLQTRFGENIIFDNRIQGPEYDGFIIRGKKEPLALIYSKNKLSRDIETKLISQKAEIIAEQNELKGKLNQLRDINVKREFATAINALVVDELTQQEILALRSEGYKVSPNYKVYATLMDSVPLINADDVWDVCYGSCECTTACAEPSVLPANTPGIAGFAVKEQQTPPENTEPPSEATYCPEGYEWVPGTQCLTGEGVTIGIIDTGVDYTHEDLGSCTTQEFLDGDCDKVIGGYDFSDNDDDPMDYMGHGTHVAATAAGNGILKGVAPDAKILAYKVFPNSYADVIISAIERSIDPNQDMDYSDHLDVISLSLGGYGDPDDDMSIAIDNAVDMGVVAVIAAGNSGPGGNSYCRHGGDGSENSICSPGTARKAITVGAIDKQLIMGDFSSRGPVMWDDEISDLSLIKPDIVAPGVDICAAQWDGWLEGQAECDPELSEHIAISGTSMATPHVSGLAALIKQRNPSYNPEEIKSVIKNTAQLLPNPEEVTTQGFGLVDSFQSTFFDNPLIVSLDPIEQNSLEIDITGRIIGNHFDHYELAYTSGEFVNENQGANWITLVSSTVLDGGTIPPYQFNQFLPEGGYLFRLRAFDTQGRIFQDYGYLEPDNFDIKEPVDNDIANPRNDLLIWVKNKNNLAIDNFQVEYSFNGGAWTSQGVNIVSNNGDDLQAIILANTLSGDGNLIVKIMVDTQGATLFFEASDILVDSTLKEGWPVKVDGYFDNNGDTMIPGYFDITIKDINSDGNSEIIFSAVQERKLTLFVLNDDGTYYNNWPIEIPGQGDPQFDFPIGHLIPQVVGDIDNDGFDEILQILQLPDNKLYAFKQDGTIVPGFPVELPYTEIFGYPHPLSFGSILLVDLDSNGDLEIIVFGNDPRFLVIYNNDGTIVDGWPVFFENEYAVTSNLKNAPSVGNFDSDIDLEIFVAMTYFDWENNREYSYLHVLNRDGSSVQAWPIEEIESNIYQSPSVGDIDGDWLTDVVFAGRSQLGVIALDKAGNTKQGWPQLSDTSFTASPALVNLNRDDKLEIVISDYDWGGSSTYLFNFDGTIVDGWPQYKPFYGFYFPVDFKSPVAITTQENPAVIFEPSGDRLYGWYQDGSDIDGFPKRVIGEATQHAAGLEDINNNDKLEVVGVSTFYDYFGGGFSSFAKIYVWETDINLGEKEWSIYQYDNQRAGCYDCDENQTIPPSSFNKTFGTSEDEYGSSVQQTSDGGYIFVGNIFHGGGGRNSKIWLIKTDGNGELEWDKIFGENGEYGFSVQQTSDGGYIIAGYTGTYGNGATDAWLIKTDENGDTCDYTGGGFCNGNGVFVKVFGGSAMDRANSVQQTSDGGYVFTGSSNSYGSGDYNVLLVKIDENAGVLMSRIFSGASDDEGLDVKLTNDGGFIIVGNTESSGNGLEDIWLIKTNSQGAQEWDKTFGTADSDYGASVQQTSDGGYIIAGTRYSGAVVQDDDAWLIKTDMVGELEWEKIFEEDGYGGGSSVQQTSDGGYIVTGAKDVYGQGADLWLAKTDSLGDLEWEETFGGLESDIGKSVQQTSDGKYIIVGHTASFGNGQNDVWLVKTSS